MSGPASENAQPDGHEDRTIPLPEADQTELPALPGRRESTRDDDDQTVVTESSDSERTVSQDSEAAVADDDKTVNLQNQQPAQPDESDRTVELPQSESATESDATVIAECDPADATALIDESPLRSKSDHTAVISSGPTADDDRTVAIPDGEVGTDDDAATVSLPEPDSDSTVQLPPSETVASPDGTELIIPGDVTPTDDPERTVAVNPELSEQTGADTDATVQLPSPGDAVPEEDSTVAMESHSGILNDQAEATVDWDGVASQDNPDATVLTNNIDPDATNLIASVDGTEGALDGTEAAFNPFDDDRTEAVESPRDGQELRQQGARSSNTPPHHGDEPRYNLVDNFAEGGMGRIWKARDARVHREVAYKELLPEALKQNSVIERFILEGQVTGQLEHPGIVPIYDLGWQDNGTPYYAMKLVNGVELKDAIRNYHKLNEGHPDRRRTLPQLLRHFVDVCNALAFAHSRGVIHRDLKPQNVMLGEFGETLVMDWGLARIVGAPQDHPGNDISVDGDLAELLREGPTTEEDTIQHGQSSGDPGGTILIPGGELSSDVTDEGLSQTKGRTTINTDARSKDTVTRFGTIMGTPLYMPPEQAIGDIEEIDSRSDIYALGAILYEILSGTQPIPRGPVMDMIQHILKKPIEPPREHNSSIPRPLDAIAMKALKKDKDDRYQNALALGRDVQNWLDDEPVSAWQDPWYDRAMRWARRNRTLVASTAAVCVMFILSAAAWASVDNARINSLATEARTRLGQAREARDRGEFDDARTLVGEALAIVESEPSLTDLQAVLNGQLENIATLIDSAERDRLSQLSQEVQRRLADARPLQESDATLDQARRIVLEAVTLLRDEPALSELAGKTQHTLASIEKRISQLEEQRAVKTTFEKFLQAADDARFYSTVVTSDDQQGSLRDAQIKAAEAFDLYGGISIEQQALPDALVNRTPFLSEPDFGLLRETVFELFLVLAECEVELARHKPDGERIAAAELALQWLALGEQLNVDSLAALLRKARYSDGAGNTAQRDLALLAAENTEASTALDFYLVGEEFRRAEDFRKALSAYRSALQMEPEYFWALNQMGLCHLLAGHPEAAVASYTAALSRRPDELICYLTRGIAYAELKQYDDAIRDLNHAAELAPEQFAVYLNRGAVHLSRGADDEALADFAAARRLRPKSDGPLINIAEVHRLNDRFEDAERVLTDAIEMSPTSAKAHHLRGLTRLALQKAEEAREDFQQVLQLDTTPSAVAESWKQIGMTWHRENEFAQALTSYDKSLDADADDPQTHRLRGEALLAIRDNNDAIDSFTEFLKRHDPVPDVLRARSVALASVGRHREAMDDYTHALRLDESPAMLVRRGWTYLNQGHQLATEDLTRAIAKNPDDPHAWNGRAFALVLQGKDAAAIRDAEKGFERALIQAKQQGPGAWPHVFNPATVFAQAIQHIEQDSSLPPEQQSAITSQLAQRAMIILTVAIQTAGPGYAEAVQSAIQSDPSLAPLRRRPEFRKQVSRQSDTK